MGLARILNGSGRTGTEGLSMRYYGDPVLERTSDPVADVTPEIRTFAQQMIEAMYRYNGVGLAAPQVGRNIRLIAIDTHQSDDPLAADASMGERILVPLMPVVLVNLEIIERRGDIETVEEGCLSFPDIYGQVARPARVVFRASLLDGSSVHGECGGLLARCMQHELDHLDGVVFPQRMTAEARSPIEKSLKTLKKNTRRHL